MVAYHILSYQSNDLPELLPEEDEEEQDRLILNILNLITNKMIK